MSKVNRLIPIYSIGVTFSNSVDQDLKEKILLKSIIVSRQRIFSDSGITLFRKLKDCCGENLAKQLAVFNR